MKTNARGLRLLKHFEGCELQAYLCPAGVWTIGFGHTGDVKKGDKITAHQADAIFELDLEKYEEGVTALLKGLTPTDDEFSALVVLAYNIGLTALANSTLLKMYRQGRRGEAADQFLRWNKGGGVELPGLKLRREAERLLFLSIPDSI